MLYSKDTVALPSAKDFWIIPKPQLVIDFADHSRQLLKGKLSVFKCI